MRYALLCIFTSHLTKSLIELECLINCWGMQKDGELKPGKKGISLRKVHWEKLCSCAQALLDESLGMKK